MGLLNDAILNDATFAFIDPDVFGESVVYTPDGGSDRTINAVVDRSPPRPLPEQPRGNPSRMIEVWVANDSTRGIAASELKLKDDTITVSDRLGKSATAHRIVQLIEADEGMLRLKLQ